MVALIQKLVLTDPLSYLYCSRSRRGQDHSSRNLRQFDVAVVRWRDEGHQQPPCAQMHQRRWRSVAQHHRQRHALRLRLHRRRGHNIVSANSSRTPCAILPMTSSLMSTTRLPHSLIESCARSPKESSWRRESVFTGRRAFQATRMIAKRVWSSHSTLGVPLVPLVPCGAV